MKRSLCSFPFLFVIAFCSLLLLVSSCKYSNTPDAVTKRFLTAFNRLDFAAAKSLSTRKTWELLDIMEEGTKNITQERKEEYARDFSVKVYEVKQESDSSMVVTFKTTPQRLPFNQLRLLKKYNKNGDIRWKVDISTLDLLNDDQYDKEPLPDDLREADSIETKS